MEQAPRTHTPPGLAPVIITNLFYSFSGGKRGVPRSSSPQVKVESVKVEQENDTAWLAPVTFQAQDEGRKLGEGPAGFTGDSPDSSGTPVESRRKPVAVNSLTENEDYNTLRGAPPSYIVDTPCSSGTPGESSRNLGSVEPPQGDVFLGPNSLPIGGSIGQPRGRTGWNDLPIGSSPNTCSQNCPPLALELYASMQPAPSRSGRKPTPTRTPSVEVMKK